MGDDSEFPECSTTEAFPGGMPLYRTTSGFSESPLDKSGEDIQECYFSSADTYEVNGVEIIAENDVCPTIVEELCTYQESNISDLYGVSEQPVSPYTVKVFVSKDDSYLREAFEKTQPLPDEVCLFLEDNSTDNLSEGTAYVKVGDRFREDLAMRKEIAAAEAGNLPQFSFINDNNESDLQIDFTEGQLKELIETGSISNTSRTVLIGIFQAINFGTIVLTPVYSFLGDGIIWITTELRKYIKFQDYHWDPEAQRPQGSEPFEPILCPLPMS